MIGMMIVSGYLFKKMSENPLPSGFLSRHGVKEKHQPLYQKLAFSLANPTEVDTIWGNKSGVLANSRGVKLVKSNMVYTLCKHMVYIFSLGSSTKR